MSSAPSRSLLLFGLEGSRDIAGAIAAELGVALAPHEEQEFEDGEHKARPSESVRGADVFVVHSLYGQPGQSGNDKLCRLLFFIGAVRDAGAASVTAVVPHLCYGRKDRRSREGDPVTTRYVAQLFESLGTDGVITLDAHNQAGSENAFRCRFESISAWPLFAARLAALAGSDPVAVLSPDAGGWKRADAMRLALEHQLGRPVDLGLMEKRRVHGAVTGGHALLGEVAGRTVVLIDDLIATGTTLVRAAEAAHAGGARRVLAAATHGLFVEGAPERFANAGFERVLVCDSIPPFRIAGSALEAQTEVLSCAPLLAAAVRRWHGG